MPSDLDAPASADRREPAVGPATPAQDLWLQDTLGLDVSSYGAKTAGAGGPAAAGGIFETVKAGVNAVVKALAGPPPIPRAALGAAQTGRADKLLKAMPPEDQKKVQALLDKAKPEEKKYLQKAVASKHSAAEMETFYKKIAGKDEAWMEKNLHVVGKGKGKGIKQQWADSCAATTAQAMKAELDPVYALKLREESPDLTEADDAKPTAKNPKLAAEQRGTLTAHGGVAVKRDDHTGGAGIQTRDALNDQTATTGLEFTYQQVTPDTFDAALTTIDQGIADGAPVPLDLGGGAGGHAVLVTGMEPGPPRRYSIHDPYDGKIVVVTDKQLKEGDFNIANWKKLTWVYKATVKDPAP